MAILLSGMLFTSNLLPSGLPWLLTVLHRHELVKVVEERPPACGSYQLSL